MGMFETTSVPIDPERVIDKVRTNSAGCVVNYIGRVADWQPRRARSAERNEDDGVTREHLEAIGKEARQAFRVEEVAITQRVGASNPDDIGLTIAVSAAHRAEAFGACSFIIERLRLIAGLPNRRRTKQGS